MPAQESIVQWCQHYVAQLLDVPPAEIDPEADFDRLGLDSALAVSLLIEIEHEYGIDLPPEELFDNPTINAVAAYLLAHTQNSVA
ncbi:acyl carrier protein [Saccharopolyspora indica]|uniref:acyl carrier protein n=1 Tax=Saccharopolyspora indica TaxID=1229659 RepID=UPI0022EB0A5F|nr:acyl carrier protein [Saccharopolyspora indica]MDA3648372.1 acyl carrier protein [Saccharopolyspora indica]